MKVSELVILCSTLIGVVSIGYGESPMIVSALLVSLWSCVGLLVKMFNG